MRRYLAALSLLAASVSARLRQVQGSSHPTPATPSTTPPIPTHSLTVPPQGNYLGDIQFIFFVYDQNGQLIISTGSEIKINAPPTMFTAMLHSGIQHHGK